MLRKPVKMLKIEVEITSTMDEEEILQVEAEEITEEEDEEISTR